MNIKQWHYTHYFDLCAVGQLLDGVAVLCVELEQDGHLEGGGLQGHDTHKHMLTLVPDESYSLTCYELPLT